MTYLLGQLRSPAYLVSELSIEGSNYQITLDILRANCEDHELILKHLLYKLLQLPSPAHNYEELERFRVTLSCTLKAMSVQKNLSDSDWIISAVIQRKLPLNMCDLLHQRYDKIHFTTNGIDEGLMHAGLEKTWEKRKKKKKKKKKKKTDCIVCLFFWGILLGFLFILHIYM